MSHTPATKEVKFLDTGKYAEHKPYLPQLEVKEVGEEHTVSAEMAKSLYDAGKVEYCVAQLADGTGDESLDEHDELAESIAAKEAEEQAAKEAEEAETQRLAESLGGGKNSKGKNKGKHKRN